MEMYEKVACVCHEANRAYCQTIGDYSQPSWGEAPDWQKESAIKGVGLHAAHPGTMPEESHEAWVHAKETEGWVYGPTKDVVNKKHPCMVPYGKLPADQQMKDAIFTAICRAMLPSA